jgi:esterase/lipase/1-acyl-sn-glycerol-3-phosphate acyltransferase
MNRFAYRTTALAIKTLENLSKARLGLHGAEKIPAGSNIFVINHFTRLETFVMPYHISKLTNVPVWSLAAAELFKGAMGAYLEKVGAVSTKNPDRDLLIVKSLLTGEAMWIIFPEGRMVKNKKIIEKGRFMISYAGGKHPPHTGAATLALRTEFYRQRLKKLAATWPEEADRLLERFGIAEPDAVADKGTYIVPVNITYYPIRARQNLLSNLALNLVENIPERVIEELMLEGSMLLSGVDMDIRFGDPIDVCAFLDHTAIRRDIESEHCIEFDDRLPSHRAMRKAALRLMERYMAAIYSMTTVNHDHLFASMLKYLKYKTTDDLDLRRRVFLAAGSELAQTKVCLHKGLQEDQIHLLTDDRYARYKDFIAVALETDVVQRQGTTLLKDFNKFTYAFDFHRIRIENPVAVMANAVEPLKLLNKRIRRLAWLPAFWIRQKVTRRLLRKAHKDFKADYGQFAVDGQSKPPSVGRPYLIKGRSRDMGILLSHGYMAAPLEVRALAEFLGRKGYWVYAPRLKGHGTSPDDLAIRTYQEWIASIEEGYGIISSICRRVVVGGFSTGAGLALELASRVKDVAGVFAVSAPLRLQDLATKLVPAVDAWNRLMDLVKRGGAKKEFVDNNPENPHINYFRNPITGVRELERLMDDLEPRLSKIHAPALVVQSDGDPVVNPKGAKTIFKRLGSEDKTYVLFSFERHGILLGEGSHRVHRTIGDFVDHLK